MGNGKAITSVIAGSRHSLVRYLGYPNTVEASADNSSERRFWHLLIKR